MTSNTEPTVMTVDDLADVRAGDKGDTLILAVVARTAEGFAILERALTAEAVGAHYRCGSEVQRTALPQLRALVFRVPDVLDGGVTGHGALDGHGKTLSYHLSTLSIEGEAR